MNQPSDDAPLREAYRRSLQADMESARPFAAMWSAAVHRGERPHAVRAYAFAAALACVLVVAAVWFGRDHSMRDADAAALSSWRSPTAALLLTSDRELLQTVPHFGSDSFQPIRLPEGS
jgi:hypothetical protein